ncbi:hypothetical protein JG687_00012709 [Phytophthora cactorum]|uniref:Uncharacterized protein n=1 Tax=Phytophthora cactorum TaxID=29920 RepID=A0A8T1U129_9STRA|nr:hypothetical protein JG687_00012709 [Phytophthora cactorum]
MVSPDDGDEDNTEIPVPAFIVDPDVQDGTLVREEAGWGGGGHFASCIISVDAVRSASALRRLDILKFFKKVEIPPRRDGGKVTRDEIYSDFGHGVRWGRRDMVQAASNKHQEVIWWLYRNTRAPRAMKSVLMVAVYNGDIVLLEWFRAKYRTQGLDPDSEDEDYEVGEEKL